MLRIGTRESELALWQANLVKEQLSTYDITSELIHIKSEGDLILDTPLPLMGGKGVFTKALDDALLAHHIDIAVHSLKDIPTQLPIGISLIAVLKRGPVYDALVARNGVAFLAQVGYKGLIATSSNRRKAQWLWKYPEHNTTDIRGNVNTRLRKLSESNWDAAIFAEAGLKRINLAHHISLILDWMLPAPAQGAVAVVGRSGDEKTAALIKSHLEDVHTEICTRIEREFLHILEAGCSAPVGGLAIIKNDEVHFTGAVFSIDGRKRMDISKKCDVSRSAIIGREAALVLLDKGASDLLHSPI